MHLGKICGFILVACLVGLSCFPHPPAVAAKPIAVATFTENPHFILLGDTQRTLPAEKLILREQNDLARQAVLQRVAEENPSFVAILGDLVAQGDSESDWKLFDDFFAPIQKKQIPLWAALGNHDYFGNPEKGLQFLFSRIPNLQEKPWNAFTFDSVAVLLMNSNFNKLNRAQNKEQLEWYRSKLQEYQNDEKIRVILVCCHHPPFTNSMIVSPDRKVQERFVAPFLETPKAKIFFTGHCHSYEHFIKQGKHFVVSGGGGGPRQPLNIESGAFQDSYAGGIIRPFHYCRVDIETEVLRVRMIQVDEELKDWSVGDEFTVPKN